MKFKRFAKFSAGSDESGIGRKSYNINGNDYLVSRTTNNQVEGEPDLELNSRP